MPARILLAFTMFAVAPFGFGATLDFTDTTIWGGADTMGTFTATQDGIETTLIAAPTGSKLTTNEGTGERNGCSSADAGLTCGGDGIGINNDEISGGTFQLLTLDFTSSVNVISISFLDLFLNEPTETVSLEVLYSQGSTESFTATAVGGLGGFLLWSPGSSPLLGVDSINFTAPIGAYNDFALAGAEISAVPLPAAAWLFGSALFVGLGIVKRRKA
jgi:hypothetical protein